MIVQIIDNVKDQSRLFIYVSQPAVKEKSRLTKLVKSARRPKHCGKTGSKSENCACNVCTVDNCLDGEGKPRWNSSSNGSYKHKTGEEVLDHDQFKPRPVLAMSRFTLSLLVQATLAASMVLRSSRIEFPSTQIEALENPFKEFNPTFHSRKLQLATLNQQGYPVVKFPEREIETVPTRERGEFDSLVHFPPKSAVEDPNEGNLPAIKKRITKRVKTNRRRVEKESGCGPRSSRRRTKNCRKTKKRVILRPQYTTFG